MPHVVIKLAAGRSRPQKERIAVAIAQAVMTTAAVREDAVSISIEDVAPSDWAAQVYEPEIAGKPETLFKKPGYGPL